MFLFSPNDCNFTAMERAAPFAEQVDISSGDSSSSDADDRKTENKQLKNYITTGQPVNELISEGTEILCHNSHNYQVESCFSIYLKCLHMFP